VSRDIARLLVVAEVISVNLVETGGIAAVKNNADVVQFGAPVQLELLELARLDGELSALPVGLGELKAVRGLFDIDPNLVWKFLQHIALAHAGIEIHSRHHHGKQHRDHSQPASQSIDREGHAEFSLIEVATGRRLPGQNSAPKGDSVKRCCCKGMLHDGSVLRVR
jgi:hypothetical protein